MKTIRKRKSKGTVFVAMSGGVDSSVAAALLQERGFNVVGIHMKMWSPRDGYPRPSRALGQQPATSNQQGLSDQAPGPHDSMTRDSMTDDSLHGVCRQQFQDRIDAMRVAAHLGIPFRTWDFSGEYRAAVVDYLIREYAAGRTPNPDVMCNREIKFGVFLERALAAGADYIATGHYVRNVAGGMWKVVDEKIGKGAPHTPHPTLHELHAAIDENKDQSYFLWTLGQEELRRTLFPIGVFTKTEVRAMARKFGLPTAEKPDSQGICFIGELDVRDFLKQRIPAEAGRVLTASGSVVGEHEGAAFYTIGQRHGLGIHGSSKGDSRLGEAGGIPYYVTAKDMATNTLTVARGPYDEDLFRRELTATDAHWISGAPPTFPLRCEARIRYRQPLQPCRVALIDADKTRINADYRCESAFSFARIRVVFDEPQRAVAPGQSVVFYRGAVMLGGAVIQ